MLLDDNMFRAFQWLNYRGEENTTDPICSVNNKANVKTGREILKHAKQT